MFCAPGLIFGGTEGVDTRFHVLRSRNSFRRYRGHRVPFSCFACPYSFSAVPRASTPVFLFCAPGIVFDGAVGVVSRLHVLRARTRFRRYRGRRHPFSCFARPNSVSTVPRASCLVFMFCAPRLIFGGTDGVVSRFHVFRARTRIQRYRGRLLPFSCFARSESISAVPRESCPDFMFCAPGIGFGRVEVVVSRFHVFRRRRGRQVAFSNFARPDSF
jgi:hypothetical protein